MAYCFTIINILSFLVKVLPPAKRGNTLSILDLVIISK